MENEVITSPPPSYRRRCGRCVLGVDLLFWQMHVLQIGTEQDFKNHNDLPLARIKRIMKSDEDVRMISAEAPVLFAKACEMFILELTLR